MATTLPEDSKAKSTSSSGRVLPVLMILSVNDWYFNTSALMLSVWFRRLVPDVGTTEAASWDALNLFFNVEADKTTPIQLEMRESKDEIQVIGNFNSENKFKRADNGEETSLLATTGRGYYIVALLGSRQEPTNHAMRDIAAVKKELEDWGRGIVLLFPVFCSRRS